MKRWMWQVLFSGLILGGQTVHAGQVSLADWCVNVNGDTSTACNGAGSGGTTGDGSTVSLANLDLTLEPSSNTLGTVSITLNAGNGSNQYISFYSDYDVAYATYGSFDDSTSVHGVQPANATFSANDPSATDLSSPYGITLFDGFYNNTLDNTNWVGTPSGPPTECCDAAWALGYGGLSAGTYTFVVSDSNPQTGFYLQQTNSDTGDSIYLSLAPEPSTFGFGLIAFGAASIYLLRRKAGVKA